MTTTPTTEQLEALAEIPKNWAQPPAHMITVLDRGKGVRLDFVGHADVTLILCGIDPAWQFEYLRDERGAMLLQEMGTNWVLEGWLTIHGVTRPCVGTCEKRKVEISKELIGDALRNGAMRFGLATKLWSKLDDVTDGHNQSKGAEKAPIEDRPLTTDETDKIITACRNAGIVFEDMVAHAFPLRGDEVLMLSQKPALTASYNILKAQRAAELQDAAPEQEVLPENPPRPATKAQVGKIKGLYGTLERDQQLIRTSEILGEKVATHNALSFDQAHRLIETLEAEVEHSEK